MTLLEIAEDLEHKGYSVDQVHLIIDSWLKELDKKKDIVLDKDFIDKCLGFEVIK
jgi:hypothetical protein